MLTIAFDNSYARDLQGMYAPVQGDAAPAPALVWLNHALAEDLGLDPAALAGPDGVAMLAGARMPQGAEPLAMAYAGHQFGGFSPQLGDGRALLVGEVIDRRGQRRDIHLKGSGRTPFSRGGDGKAALGPVLREVLIGEAMAGLGIPTTRALAAVTTGDTIWRETPLPGAVLARVAASHLRVGTFQFFYARQDLTRLRRLADYAIARHDPDLVDSPDRYLAFFHRVTQRQMDLIARWMAVGFIHGVMNTDNMTISGETIDFGPCAFLESHDPATVFSSIDRQGRYAYGNQPLLARWNLARLGETLLPLIAANPDEALPHVQAAIEGAEGLYETAWAARLAAKLGLAAPDASLGEEFLKMLTAQGGDFTLSFGALTPAAGGDEGALRARIGRDPRLDGWLARWRAALDPGSLARMAGANPVYIPRNHRVEEALAAAHHGNLAPLHRLLDVLATPFQRRDGFADLEEPAPTDAAPYVTFCGT